MAVLKPIYKPKVSVNQILRQIFNIIKGGRFNLIQHSHQYKMREIRKLNTAAYLYPTICP